MGHSEATFKMSYDFDIQADYRIRDTNVTQQSGAGQGTANLVDKVIAQKQRIQPDATLCIEYKKRKAPLKDSRMYRITGEMKSSRPALTQM